RRRQNAQRQVRERRVRDEKVEQRCIRDEAERFDAQKLTELLEPGARAIAKREELVAGELNGDAEHERRDAREARRDAEHAHEKCERAEVDRGGDEAHAARARDDLERAVLSGSTYWDGHGSPTYVASDVPET